MKPITFKEANISFAKDQPQYPTTPAHADQAGNVTTCWQLSWLERFAFLFLGKLWITQRTFNTPLQPVYPVALNPLTEVKPKAK